MKNLLKGIGVILTLSLFYSCEYDEIASPIEMARTEMQSKSELDPKLSDEVIKLASDLVRELSTSPSTTNQTNRMHCHKYYSGEYNGSMVLSGAGVFAYNGRYFYFEWFKDAVTSLQEIPSSSVSGKCGSL